MRFQRSSITGRPLFMRSFFFSHTLFAGKSNLFSFRFDTYWYFQVFFYTIGIWVLLFLIRSKVCCIKFPVNRIKIVWKQFDHIFSILFFVEQNEYSFKKWYHWSHYNRHKWKNWIHRNIPTIKPSNGIVQNNTHKKTIKPIHRQKSTRPKTDTWAAFFLPSAHHPHWNRYKR